MNGGVYSFHETNFRCKRLKIKRLSFGLKLNTNKIGAEYAADLVTFMWGVLWGYTFNSKIKVRK